MFGYMMREAGVGGAAAMLRLGREDVLVRWGQLTGCKEGETLSAADKDALAEALAARYNVSVVDA
ncbi:MAG: hypothetical protein ACPG61_18170 [Paracoccaceae bacterium]